MEISHSILSVLTFNRFIHVLHIFGLLVPLILALTLLHSKNYEVAATQATDSRLRSQIQCKVCMYTNEWITTTTTITLIIVITTHFTGCYLFAGVIAGLALILVLRAVKAAPARRTHTSARNAAATVPTGRLTDPGIFQAPESIRCQSVTETTAATTGRESIALIQGALLKR